MLTRIATACFAHRKRVLVVWLALIVASVGLSTAFAGRWSSDTTLKGTDSQAAYNLLSRQFPAEAGEEDAVLFSPASAHHAEIETWLAGLRTHPGVTDVSALERAPHGDIAEAAFYLSEDDTSSSMHDASVIESFSDTLHHDGVKVAFGGDSFESASSPDSEVFGIVAGLIVLLVLLGSVIAAGLPIVTALAGIALGVPLIAVLARVVPTPDFTDEVAVMLGIGVGIDYTLLMVSRFRTALATRRAGRTGPIDRADVLASVVEAETHAGRSVAIAGCTVMVAMGGLFLMNVDIYNGLALGCALAVATAVAASLTLLPATLGFVGARIGRKTPPATSPSSRLVRLVQRRPAALATGGLVLLALLTVPILSMHLAENDAGTDPTGTTTRVAYEMTSAGWGPGANGPVLVVCELPGHNQAADLRTLTRTLRSEPGVVSVGPVTRSIDGRAAIVTVTPEWSPSSTETSTLVRDMRRDLIPVDRSSGLQAHVGGETASDIDFAHLTAERLPWLIGGVLLISFLILLISFRSMLIAVQAVVANLFSVGAAYGLLVAVFQWGWGAHLIGATPAPIPPWIPPMLFAIVFGLSMDYEVFLVGAIREARSVLRPRSRSDRLSIDRAAVATGLCTTARIITAAALIMTLVFGSFVASDMLSLKAVGFGLAVAVAIDATIIRLLVVPAFLTLLGPKAWWPSRPARPALRAPQPMAEPLVLSAESRR
jgi:putative drug exporter of the RND superfamily